MAGVIGFGGIIGSGTRTCLWRLEQFLREHIDEQTNVLSVNTLHFRAA
jgi:hypothetical protein